MTPEDLQAIRAIVHEEVATIVHEEIAAAEQRTHIEIAASEQRTREGIAAAEQRIAAIVHEEVAASEQRTHKKIAAFELASAANLSDVRQELLLRLDTLDRRTERLEVGQHSLLMQTAGMSKSLTDAERIDSAMVATQGGQQHAINDLYAKLAEIRRQLEQRPQQNQ